MPTESCSWIASFAPHASSVVLSSTPVFRYEREARYGTGVVVESFGTVACIGPAPIDADQMQKYEQTERRGRVKILSIRRAGVRVRHVGDAPAARAPTCRSPRRDSSRICRCFD